jgi:hypothetical protein
MGIFCKNSLLIGRLRETHPSTGRPETGLRKPRNPSLKDRSNEGARSGLAHKNHPVTGGYKRYGKAETGCRGSVAVLSDQCEPVSVFQT